MSSDADLSVPRIHNVLPNPLAGNRSLVIAATLSSDVLNKAKKDKKYKQWLIQWALEKVEEKMGVDLSRSESDNSISICLWSTLIQTTCMSRLYRTEYQVERLVIAEKGSITHSCGQALTH
jgi:hypothetical protein